MKRLLLTLKEPPRQRLDLSALTKDGFAAKTRQEVAEMRLFVGRRSCRLADLFKISGEPGERLVIRNGSERLDGIGTGWREGELIVHGDVGAYLGREMSGGTLTVRGNAGPFAASRMSGGKIIVEGDAGDFLGAPMAGERAGINGGVVHVMGNAGDRAGDQMRRGILLVEGDVGGYCASRMIAGSIAVMGNVGPNLGIAMRRGSVLLMCPPRNIPATFNDCGKRSLPFYRLFIAHLRSLGGRFAGLDPSHDRMRRYVGDRSVDGKGEILFYE